MSKKSKRQLKKLDLPYVDQGPSVDERIYLSVASTIHKGERYPDLQQRYKEAVLNRALAEMAVKNPRLLDQALGHPYSEQKILIDECLNVGFLPHVHRLLGRAVTARKIVPHKTKDNALFQMSMDQGFAAILTADGNTRYTSDLCTIANSHYGMKVHNAPGVIVVSQDIRTALQELSANVQDIRTYIQSPPKKVLDLRP